MHNITEGFVSRNKQWDLMRAIGIIAVVWGHLHQPQYLFYPVFQFHVSLFFFVSGYFFTPRFTITDKVTYIIRKTRTLLLHYLAFNLFFGLVTAWLKTMQIDLGGELSLHNIFIAPFGVGDQYTLYLAAWFLFNLYFISVFAGIVYGKNKKINVSIMLLATAAMMILLLIGNNPDNNRWLIFLIRSVFGFCFFSYGYLFHLYENTIQKYIIRPITCVILVLIIDVLNANFGDMSYTIVFGTVNNKFVIAPIINSLCIIFLIYTMTYYAAKVIKSSSIVHEIGEYSAAIMIWHFTFFFLFNVVLYKLSLVPFSALSSVYFTYKKEQLWLFYELPAIFAPVLFMRYWNIWKRKIVLRRIRSGNSPSLS